MKDMTVEAVNETDAVLEDLFDQYGVELIPSSEQYLLVRHLRLKSEQDLHSRLRRLGFAPLKRRVEGVQVRLWIRKDAAIENGRVYCPRLTATLQAAGEMPEGVERGFVWWPITTLAKRWDLLATNVLGGSDGSSGKSEMKRWSQTVGHDEDLQNGHTGPYQDSSSLYSYWGGKGPHHSPLTADEPDTDLGDLSF